MPVTEEKKRELLKTLMEVYTAGGYVGVERKRRSLLTSLQRSYSTTNSPAAEFSGSEL